MVDKSGLLKLCCLGELKFIDLCKCMVKLFMCVLFVLFFLNMLFCNYSYIIICINIIVVLIVFVLNISIDICVK